MPNSVEIAAPTAVMPLSLSTAFAASRDWTVDTNQYANGDYQSFIPQVYDPNANTTQAFQSSRRAWQITKRLTATQWSALLAFWLQVGGCRTEFWFYDPYETVPPFSYDPSGAATSGRYAVRFNGSLTASQSTGRAVQVNISLLEVA